jgi:hypothetical protein
LKSIIDIFNGAIWPSILIMRWWLIKGFTDARTEVFFRFYIFDVENLKQTGLGDTIGSISHFEADFVIVFIFRVIGIFLVEFIQYG